MTCPAGWFRIRAVSLRPNIESCSATLDSRFITRIPFLHSFFGLFVDLSQFRFNCGVNVYIVNDVVQYISQKQYGSSHSNILFLKSIH